MEIPCRVYRPRDPRKTPLFGLLDSLYDRVKGAWEERFERSYGFWRGLVDEVVARYLDCVWGSGLQASGSRPDFPVDIQIEIRYSIGMSNREQAKADVLQGTLDLMILQTLATLGPLHGYAIAARLEQVSAGALRLNMGTLYPGLMRLEQRGLVRGEWGVTDNNRKARFYNITATGRRQLAAEKAEWDRMVTIIRTLLSEQG